MINLTKEEFKKTVQKNSIVQVHNEIACDFITPVGFFSKINKEYSFILESVECSEQFGRFSIVGIDPKFTIKTADQSTQINDFDQGITTSSKNPLDLLKEIKNKYTPLNFSGLKGFFGGAVGYLSYDIISHIEDINLNNKDDLNLPEMYFIVPKTVILFDNLKHTVKLVCNIFTDQDLTKLDQEYEQAIKKLKELENLFNKAVNLPLLSLETSNNELNFTSNLNQESFHTMVNQAKQNIVEGEIIQVVLSQRFSVDFQGDSLDLYRSLRMINPSPYMFLINFPGFSIIGSSPEILVKEIDKKVTIRPIAGTRKRGTTIEEDLYNEKDLLNDKKEIAEHVMLVDLARNDIGRVCKGGTVTPDKLLTIERYSHVMHIVSNVTGELDDNKDAFDLLKATFPAGTLSGAPKVRAMEIIEELEPTKRGAYGGSVAYFDFNGNFDSCITIRTIVLKEQKAFIQAGAGIVYDSQPESEYQETINKAKAMFKAIDVANSIVKRKESTP